MLALSKRIEVVHTTVRPFPKKEEGVDDDNFYDRKYKYDNEDAFEIAKDDWHPGHPDHEVLDGYI